MPSKEAVILIPGFFAKAQNDYLDKLLTIGLTSRLSDWHVEVEREPIKIAGQTGQRFNATSHDGEAKTLDIYEVYWLDLIEKLGEKSLKDQVFRGLYLFIFCFTFRIWAMAKQSRKLWIQFMIVMGLVVLWYYGVVAIALTAIGQNPSSFGISLPAQWGTALTQVGQAMGSWSVWALVSIFLGLLPISISTLVNQLDFTARYLDDEVDVDRGSLRDRIRLRVKMALDDVLKQGEYERVTILAHSFGVTIAANLLSQYRNPTSTPIRLVSLGGLMEFYSYKAHWIIDESEKCLNNPTLESWNDYYSFQDWLCTKTPAPKTPSSVKLTNHLIRFRAPLFKQITGDTHVAYFYDYDILKDLLES